LSGKTHQSFIIAPTGQAAAVHALTAEIYVTLIDLDQRRLTAAGRRYEIIGLSSDRASIDETENIGSKP
jgi:23S rRNA G2069 N7-methylase RlmK/C1962 C5-methylase RlmI